MTHFAETGDKWFTVYVPKSTTPSNGSGTATTYESYLRVGGPDVTNEQTFLDSLKASYHDVETQNAVAHAFGASPTGGMALYTEGDVMQFVGGKVDTRVLNDSFAVHVLNRSDVQSATASADAVKTFRAYFRLGKPNSDIEKPLEGSVNPDSIKEFIAGLAKPRGDYSRYDGDVTAKKEAVLTGDLNAREWLLKRATLGDSASVDAVDQLRKSTDTRADTVYDGKTAKKWALATLQAVHTDAANYRRDQAIKSQESRTKLETRARDAKDAVARRKLTELAESRNPDATCKQGDLTAARDWAKSSLDAMSPADELAARFSLGDGVALYSDRAVTLSTPEALKVTVGKDTRTVLGPTYSETYDVSDDIINGIKDGWISSVSEVSDKKLMTAVLTDRDLTGLSWRTTKFDLTKALTFAAADVGGFSVGSAYTFAAGLKLGNSLGIAFDAATGASLGAPCGIKVELSSNGIETGWARGKIAYKDTASTKGTSVTIAVDPLAKACSLTMKPLADVIRYGMAAVNGALTAYTAAFAAIGATTTSESTDGPTANVKEMMETGEKVYLGAAGLNAILAAITLVAGVVQIATEKAAKAAIAVSPMQPTNIELNDGGIKLQAGTTYIHIGPSGIMMSAAQVLTASPLANFVPATVPGNMTPVAVLQAAEAFGSAAVGTILGAY